MSHLSERARVTIGVPVYNGERFLASTIESLLRQTVEDFVILVADNASTDRTEAIARDYAACDSRVRYHRHPRNIGVAANFAFAFREADTEFFRWSSADDLSEPELLETCLDAMNRCPDAVLVYPRIMMIDAEGRDLGLYEERLHLPQDRPSERFTRLLENIGLCNAHYGLMRSAAVRRTRLMGSYLGSDIVFQAELSLYGKFLELPQVLFRRRIHPASFTSLTDPAALQEFYEPGSVLHPDFRAWRHLAEHLLSVLRAPLRPTEGARLLRFLIRRAIGSRERFLHEAAIAGRLLLSRKR